MKKLAKTALIGSLSCLMASPVFADLNDGLVAYYPFNGNANDESGNENDGIVNGASLSPDRFGIVNSAYLFDGIDDYIECNNKPVLNGKWSGVTISAWIKPNSYSSEVQFIAGKWAFVVEGDHYALSLGEENNKLKMGVADGITAEQGGTALSSLTPKSWYHVVGTWNSSSKIYTLYVNGFSDGTSLQTGSGLISNSSTSLKIGREIIGRDRPFNGNIDDVRIYNRALSESEIEELYQLGSEPTKTYDDGFKEGIAKCQNAPVSCGITVPPESGNCPSVEAHASFSPSDGTLTIPAVDVPDAFGGMTTYRAEMSLMEGEGLVFSVTNAEPVQ